MSPGPCTGLGMGGAVQDQDSDPDLRGPRGSWARGRDGRGRGEAEGQGWRLPREVGPEDTALRDGGQQRHRGSENGHFGGMGSRVGLERGGRSPGKACG